MSLPPDANPTNEWTNEGHVTEYEEHGDFIGNILQENKSENTTRVGYFHNLNGLKWDRQGGTWPMVCHAMAGIHADIACFSEINQDTQN